VTFVEKMSLPELGRVRWRRFAIILAPATALMVLLLVLTEQSVLAVSISISGKPINVTAKQLQGQGFELFGVTQHSATNDLPGHSNQIVLAATALRSAKITGLCQSVDILGVPMIITAGNGGTPAVATNLVVDADHFSGNASFKQLTLGRDASTLDMVPGVLGQAGGFSMKATQVSISDLVQHAYSVTASSFTLPGFQLRFGGGC
jgi:hypothetical protein